MAGVLLNPVDPDWGQDQDQDRRPGCCPDLERLAVTGNLDNGGNEVHQLPQPPWLQWAAPNRLSSFPRSSGFSFSTAISALSISCPMWGRLAFALSDSQRASASTRNTVAWV